MFNETDEAINKLVAAFNHNIIPILCVGEALNQEKTVKQKTSN